VLDHILQKPETLTGEERLIMQRHTVIAATTLQKVAKVHGFSIAFFQMAVEIARHHHERFDGKGYSDRLAGEEILLSARIVAITDVYDALRSKRVYKPALPHADAMRMMADDPGHFDPFLLAAFQRCCEDFERIFQQLTD
jgi:putative two-component system response regulator